MDGFALLLEIECIVFLIALLNLPLWIGLTNNGDVWRNVEKN